MSSTADLVRQGDGLAQQAHVVLSQADQVRARAIRAMKASAGTEDRVAAVLAELARQRPEDADRLWP